MCTEKYTRFSSFDTNSCNLPREGEAPGFASAIAMQSDMHPSLMDRYIDLNLLGNHESGKRRKYGRAADALAQEADEGRGKPR